jgi:DNA modification methylase
MQPKRFFFSRSLQRTITIGRQYAKNQVQIYATTGFWVLIQNNYSHPAAFPRELARRCILLGSREGDWVLDPFGGSGTTGLVANELERNAMLVELNPEYAQVAKERGLDGST